MNTKTHDNVTVFTDTGGIPVAIKINCPKRGIEVGRFTVKKGKLTFEGKTDKAAAVFVDYVLDIFNERIENLISEKNDL